MPLQEIYDPFCGGQYVYLENFLTKLGDSDLFSVCVKDIKTKKVCLYNSVCGKFWNLLEGAMHGMTARDILTRVPNFINVEGELKNIEKHESMAIETREQSVFQHVLLSYDGYVQVRQSMIVPLNGISNRLIATVGLAFDLTRYVHPSDLLLFYRYYYPKRAESVSKYCSYLNLDNYFYEVLSYEELRTLLVMVGDYRHKKVAEFLGASPKTVANYLASVRDKLKPNVDIYMVLSALRAQKQWQFGNF